MIRDVTHEPDEIQNDEENHRKRHQELHLALDELIADWLDKTKKLPSESTVMELMQWSHKQTKKPD